MKIVFAASLGVVALFATSVWLIKDGDESAQATPPPSASNASRAEPDASLPPTTGNWTAASAKVQSGGRPKASPSTASSGLAGSPPPEPVHSDIIGARPRVDFWVRGSGAPAMDIDGIPASQLQVDPAVLRSLHVGQTLDLELPPLNRTVSTTLASTHNQLNKVQVFKGPITSGSDKDNVIVTRGEHSTYVVIATQEGVFSAVINNRTGAALLTDESDINRGMIDHDDAVVEQGIAMPIPEQDT